MAYESGWGIERDGLWYAMQIPYHYNKPEPQQLPLRFTIEEEMPMLSEGEETIIRAQGKALLSLYSVQRNS